MALTRKALKELGLTEEQITQVIEGHSETVNNLKEQIAQYKEEAEKVPGLQRELEEAKENAGKDDYEGKYNTLKAEYDQYKADIQDKETKSAKRAAYEALLKEVGISGKRLPSVLKIADLATIELDDKGKIKNRAAIEKTVKEEFSDFIETHGEEGADPATPPENDGGKGGEKSRAAEVAARYYNRVYGNSKTNGGNKE